MSQILVTRPMQDFERSADQISAKTGFTSLSAPMMEFAPLKLDHEIKLESFAAVIFTSANGIRAFEALNLANSNDVNCYCVGKQTAAMAHELGYNILAVGKNDAISLGYEIIHNYHLKKFSKALLHLSGVHQAGNLSKFLIGEGIKTQSIQIYEMIATVDFTEAVQLAFKQDEIKAITFYSSRSAKIFIEIAKKSNFLQKIVKISVFCLSENIAVNVCNPYFKNIYFVKQPDENALIELMHQELKR